MIQSGRRVEEIVSNRSELREEGRCIIVSLQPQSRPDESFEYGQMIRRGVRSPVPPYPDPVLLVIQGHSGLLGHVIESLAPFFTRLPILVGHDVVVGREAGPRVVAL